MSPTTPSTPSTPADDRFLTDTEVDVEGLLGTLRARADNAGLIDVAFRTLATRIGTLLLAATPEGLVRVAFEIEGEDAVLQSLAERVSPRILRAPGRLDEAAHQIEQYLDGRRHDFELPLDRALSSGYRRTVQDLLPAIAYGSTASYGDLAARTGKPGAARAVGTACATNPLPLVIPCHRVVRSDGSTGQYAGGPQIKVDLLAMERDGSPMSEAVPSLW